jgi:hypothetical protein
MTKHTRLYWLLLALLMMVASPAVAIEYRRIGQDYRAMAMGNTGIASANNSASLFYNPATMANIFTWWVDFPYIQLTYSDDAYSLVEQARSGSFNLETKDEQIDFMNRFIGSNPYLKIDLGTNLFINLDRKGFTVGGNYSYEATLDLEVTNPSLPELHSFTRLDHIRQVGLSMPIGLGKLVLGAVYKTVERSELSFEFTMDQAMNEERFPTLASDGVNGFGSGYDIGFLYRIPTGMRLMIGGVYRTAIELGNATGIPAEVAMGLATTHELGIYRLTAAMDLRDLTFQQGSEGDRSLMRRLHYGLELGILPLSRNTSWITLRTGYNQGYIAEGYQGLTGVEISLGRSLVMGYTQYIEEVGEYAGQKPSPRTVIYLSTGF